MKQKITEDEAIALYGPVGYITEAGCHGQYVSERLSSNVNWMVLGISMAAGCDPKVASDISGFTDFQERLKESK